MVEKNRTADCVVQMCSILWRQVSKDGYRELKGHLYGENRLGIGLGREGTFIYMERKDGYREGRDIYLYRQLRWV